MLAATKLEALDAEQSLLPNCRNITPKFWQALRIMFRETQSLPFSIHGTDYNFCCVATRHPFIIIFDALTNNASNIFKCTTLINAVTASCNQARSFGCCREPSELRNCRNITHTFWQALRVMFRKTQSRPFSIYRRWCLLCFYETILYNYIWHVNVYVQTLYSHQCCPR